MVSGAGETRLRHTAPGAAGRPGSRRSAGQRLPLLHRLCTGLSSMQTSGRGGTGGGYTRSETGVRQNVTVLNNNDEKQSHSGSWREATTCGFHRSDSTGLRCGGSQQETRAPGTRPRSPRRIIFTAPNNVATSYGSKGGVCFQSTTDAFSRLSPKQTRARRENALARCSKSQMPEISSVREPR